MKKTKKDEGKPDAFQEIMATLSSRALAGVEHQTRHILTPTAEAPPLDDERDDFEREFSSLSERTQRQFDDDVAASTVEPIEPDVGAAKYCTIESPDGEFGVLRGFKTPEEVAIHLGKLEGKDTTVHVVYGIPMRFTAGPQRYLMLPDGQQAIMIPTYPGGPTKVVEANLLEDLEVQEDGFVGPPELVNTPEMPEKEPKKKKGKKQAKYGPDDEDDDESEEADA